MYQNKLEKICLLQINASKHNLFYLKKHIKNKAFV